METYSAKSRGSSGQLGQLVILTAPFASISSQRVPQRPRHLAITEPQLYIQLRLKLGLLLAMYMDFSI